MGLALRIRRRAHNGSKEISPHRGKTRFVSVADGHAPQAARVDPRGLERLLYPLHWIVFRHRRRRGIKLLRFAETEADGGRDLARAAELTSDALLRRLYLRHAQDEQRHAELFRQRGGSLLASLPDGESATFEANWIAPGERGLDDLRVDSESDESLLAFLHLSERAAAARFAVYERVLVSDPDTQRVFAEILRDEAFHMNYTHAQLQRVSPKLHRAKLFWARATRLWRGYLRIATALASVIAGILLVVQYFAILPIFAVLARRAARNERAGFVPRSLERPSFTSQYG
jgi:rubrerythrin